MRSVNQGARSVSFYSSKNSRPSQIQFAAFLDDRAIKRLALPFVIFSEMDSQHFCAACEFHWRASFLLSSPREPCEYLTMSTSERTTSPCWIMESKVGKNRRSFSSASITDNMIGRS